MRRLLAFLPRWLGRSIDARIAAAAEAACARSAAVREQPAQAADTPTPQDLGFVPAGHAALVEMARQSVRDISLLRGA